MYAMNVFFSRKYEDTITYADTVLAAVNRTKDIPDIEKLYIYEKLAIMYSEAEILDKAELVACEFEDIIENLKREGYSEKIMKDYHMLPAQFNNIVISKEMIMYLNHAIILSRAERTAEADEYLSKAEKMCIQYPDVASSEPGIVKRISLFRKNGLPKSKKNGDSEKIYRQYKTQIENMLSKCLKSRQFDETELQQIIELIEKMSSMPEHEIYKEPYTMVKYYNALYLLSNDIGCKNTAIKMLKKAAFIADDDNSNEELYAEIYSDMCAYTYDLSKRLYYVKKALAIYESLRNSGKEYNQYSYAMTLHNIGLILAKKEIYDEALNYSQKALCIWESIYFSKPDEQIGLYLSEEKRLIEFLKTKVK